MVLSHHGWPAPKPLPSPGSSSHVRDMAAGTPCFNRPEVLSWPFLLCPRFNFRFSLQPLFVAVDTTNAYYVCLKVNSSQLQQLLAKAAGSREHQAMLQR